jgi:hypothetical protein
MVLENAQFCRLCVGMDCAHFYVEAWSWHHLSGSALLARQGLMEDG